jgi:hypothetical protein
VKDRFQSDRFCAALSDVFVPEPTHTWRQCYAHFWRSILPRRITHKTCPSRTAQIPSSTLASPTFLPDMLRWPVPSSIRTFPKHCYHFLPRSSLIIPTSYISINPWWISIGEVLRVVKLPKPLPLNIKLSRDGHLALALSQALLLSQAPTCNANKMFVWWKMERLDRDTEMHHLEEEVVD